MILPRRRATAAIAVSVLVVLALSSAFAATAPQSSGTLRVALAGFEEDNLDPKFTGATTILRISAPMYDYLTWLSPKFEVLPGLAESWEVGPDRRTYTFHLRRGVKFHNGDPLTAEDVKFSFERYMEKDARTTKAGAFRSSIQSIQIVDPATVIFNLKRIDHEFLLNVGPYLGSGPILPKDYFAKVGADGFSKAPIGSGPWRLVKHDPGTSIDFQAMPGHWRGQPKFERLILLSVPEESSRVTMLQRGEAQIAEIGVQRRDELIKQGLEVRRIPSVTQFGIQFFMSWLAKDNPVSDARVRKALAMAVDHEGIIKSILLGEGERSLPFGIFPGAPFADASRPSQRPIPYDPPRARALLREAGVSSGFDLTLYSLSIGGAPYLQRVSTVIAANWAAIGVRTKIVPIEFAALRPLYTNHDKTVIGAASSFRYPAIFTGSFSCDARGVLRSTGPQSLLNSPKVDELCDAVLAAITPEEAGERMKLVFDEVDREFPQFTIGYANALYGIDPKVVGAWSPIRSILDLGPIYESIARAH